MRLALPATGIITTVKTPNLNHMDFEAAPDPSPLATEGQVAWTYVIYGLHSVSVLAGLLSPALVVMTFVSGWPSIIAVILNYALRADVRGTFLETHFRWQIRTFWFALMWVLIALLFVFTFVGIPFAVIIAWVAGLWVLYRILRGLLRLLDRQPMPQ
jgi:uncharacterized membrane protein